MSRASESRGAAAKRLLPMVLLMSALCACKPPGYVPPPGVVLLGDGRLNQYVVVDPINMAPTDTGTLRAWSRIENRTTSTLPLLARFAFVGAQNQPVEPAPGWSRLFVEAGGSVVFEGLSMNSRAQHTALEIKLDTGS